MRVKAVPNDPMCRRFPTWANLLPLLHEAGIAPEQCFFTNAYMGLREGAGTTGRFPGSRDEQFVERCRAFFLHQIRAQQPRVVLALGVCVSRLEDTMDILAENDGKVYARATSLSIGTVTARSTMHSRP